MIRFIVMSLGWVLLAAIGLAPLAVAQPAQVTLRVPNQLNVIEGLKFSAEEFAPQVEIEHGSPHVEVTVKGSYRNSESGLITGMTVIYPDPSGSFDLKVLLTGASTRLDLFAVDPRGKLQNEKVELLFPEFDAFLLAASKLLAEPKAFTAALALSFLSFEQAEKPDFSETAMTGKLGYVLPLLSPPWDLGVGAFATLFPISRNQDAVARFLGVNLRAGYQLPFVRTPWQMKISLGGYYTTMFVTDDRFGFQNMFGPQIFVTAQRALADGDQLAAYFKFATVTPDGRSLDFSSRELAFGGSYSRPLQNGHPISATLDMAWLSVFPGGIQISSDSVSLGAGYGF